MIGTACDPLQKAVENLKDDPGALFEAPVLEALRVLNERDPAAFARVRQQAKDTKNVQMAEFDRLTKPFKLEADSGNNLFHEVVQWPEPVAGNELLSDIEKAFSQHIIADKETLRAAALWCAFTWFIDVVQVAPIANITAPEKRCGKSEMLSALARLAYHSLQVSGVSSAALFRSIELWKPSLMIDEVDAFLRDNEEARGILNAGFTRDSAFIIRCEGDDHIPKKFNVWGAKALCGIGSIADTLADRSIPLRLRRKMPHETIERLRFSDPDKWDELRARLCRFAEDNFKRVADARPEPIPGLNDRANDCWEPLLAVAEVAGGVWPDAARRAAIALHGIEEEAPTIGVELLRDIKSVFDDKRSERIFTADLLEALTEDDEQPWATWFKGKPMTPRQLSNRLKDYGIKSKQIRIGSMTKKGFEQSQFEDAWKRYGSALPPSTSETTTQPTDDAASSDFGSETHRRNVSDEKELQPTDGGACVVVSDKSPPQPERKVNGSKSLESDLSGYEELASITDYRDAKRATDWGSDI